MVEKQNAGRVALRQKLAAIAKEHGLTHPKNPQNSWNRPGPHAALLVAATKGSKAKKDDFLV
jgi:hypothetical protein